MIHFVKFSGSQLQCVFCLLEIGKVEIAWRFNLYLQVPCDLKKYYKWILQEEVCIYCDIASSITS